MSTERRQSGSVGGAANEAGGQYRRGVAALLMRRADRRWAWACRTAYSPSWTEPRPSRTLGTLSSSNRTGRSGDCATTWRATRTCIAGTTACSRQNERLRRENEHLKKQLGAERRAGRRQAAPFAKDRPQGRGGRPGRRPGARYGRPGRRPCPARVDETLAAPAPATCPDCGGAVEVTGAASQYQEDLPPVRPAGAPFRHRGRPLLAVSAAYPGPARPADFRRVGGGARTARPRYRVDARQSPAADRRVRRSTETLPRGSAARCLGWVLER